MTCKRRQSARCASEALRVAAATGWCRVVGAPIVRIQQQGASRIPGGEADAAYSMGWSRWVSAVWRRPDHYLVIADEFVGSGQHEIEVNYQFAPGTLQPLEEGVALFDGAVDIAWLGNTRWRAEIKAGGAGPHDGPLSRDQFHV